jgi:NADH:ubiquinone oxidoreductase subunit 6 (subunit J)
MSGAVVVVVLVGAIAALSAFAQHIVLERRDRLTERWTCRRSAA